MSLAWQKKVKNYKLKSAQKKSPSELVHDELGLLVTLAGSHVPGPVMTTGWKIIDEGYKSDEVSSLEEFVVTPSRRSCGNPKC